MRLGTSMKWVVVLAMLACATVGLAAEASVSLDVASAYVFRGAVGAVKGRPIALFVCPAIHTVHPRPPPALAGGA